MYERISIENRRFRSESVCPKISGRRGRLPPTILLVRKLGRMISFMWCKNVGTSFFGFVTMHEFDRQKDRRTDRKALEIPCGALHAVER